jgi:phospholipid/cholesterol/gamma-HCH transport system permease protein
VVAAPLLHVLIAVVALGGGFAAEAVAGQTTWLKYRTAAVAELRWHEVLPAGLKTLAFGWLVGVTGCFVGLTAEGGSDGVGRAATRGVVLSILLVLAADVALVGLIRVTLGG